MPRWIPGIIAWNLVCLSVAVLFDGLGRGDIGNEAQIGWTGLQVSTTFFVAVLLWDKE